MAYAAAISLKRTMLCLAGSSHISLVPPSLEILRLAFREMMSLQKTLDSNCTKRVHAQEAQIREAVSKFEDVLESLVSNQIVSQSEESRGDETHPWLFSIDLQDLKEDVHSFIETLKKMEEEYIEELGNASPEEIEELGNPLPGEIEEVDNVLPEEEKDGEDDDDDDAVSSRMDSGGKKSKIVGISFIEMVKKLKSACRKALCSTLTEEEEDDVVSSRIGFGGKKPKMDGLPDEYNDFKALDNSLLEEEDDPVSSRIGFGEKQSKMDGLSDEFSDLKALDNSLPEEEDDAVSSRIDFDQKKSKMVGHFSQFSEIKSLLMDPWSCKFHVFSLVGMAGIGKTTLAKEIFEDPDILEFFDNRAWVTVGRKWQLEEIQRVILAQWDPDGAVLKGGEKSLKGSRYLIVLDDVWGKEVWGYLKSSIPYCEGSRILLTTRLQEVARDASFYLVIFKMQLLNKEESWDLLRGKVFAEKPCPPQLEKAGKKIAEHCEGLPLTIVKVAELLSTAEKTPEYWNKVAEKQNLLFMDAYDQILDALYPSYEYLPQHLKVCFLYMGVFPQNYEIPKSKLIHMWLGEGFLEPDIWQAAKKYIEKCLHELISNNNVMLFQESTIRDSRSVGVKTCRVHSSMWHLCNREARKNKFLEAQVF